MGQAHETEPEHGHENKEFEMEDDGKNREVAAFEHRVRLCRLCSAGAQIAGRVVQVAYALAAMQVLHHCLSAQHGSVHEDLMNREPGRES